MVNGKDVTLQVDGCAKIVSADGAFAKLYIDKFREKQGKWPNDIFLSVEPVWWSYIDWSKPGKVR